MFRITAQTLQYQLGSLGQIAAIQPTAQEPAIVKSMVQRILQLFPQAKR